MLNLRVGVASALLCAVSCGPAMSASATMEHLFSMSYRFLPDGLVGSQVTVTGPNCGAGAANCETELEKGNADATATVSRGFPTTGAGAMYPLPQPDASTAFLGTLAAFDMMTSAMSGDPLGRARASTDLSFQITINPAADGAMDFLWFRSATGTLDDTNDGASNLASLSTSVGGQQVANLSYSLSDLNGAPVMGFGPVVVYQLKQGVPFTLSVTAKTLATAATVPVPGSVMFLASALLGLGVFARSRRSP